MFQSNPNLIHVDLSYCQLTEAWMMLYGQNLRRSKSLRAVHLSGNDVSQEMIQALAVRIHGVVLRRRN
jgi:hypothetical protein